MRRTLCKSKIHRAILTSVDLHYEGSITIDSALMQRADLVPYEKVQVVNVNNGARFETYVIEGVAGSGSIQLNGAAARLGCVGDCVIIMSYAEYDAAEIQSFSPLVVLVDAHNHILSRVSAPAPVTAPGSPDAQWRTAPTTGTEDRAPA